MTNYLVVSKSDFNFEHIGHDKFISINGIKVMFLLLFLVLVHLHLLIVLQLFEFLWRHNLHVGFIAHVILQNLMFLHVF